MNPKSPTFSAAGDMTFSYREKVNPGTSNLQFLTYGVYDCGAAAGSGQLAHPGEEALLFCWKGGTRVRMEDASYLMHTYDVLYIPRGASYSFEGSGAATSVIVCRAPAATSHPAFHARWADFSKDEKRIRHLKGKDVFLMFDVTEKADKLIAGYTIFQPHQRSWPPHNHTDQEEIYIFTQGRGAMEVYAEEETKSFVHSVTAGDAVTIPLLNFHPVFSHDEDLHFIWCIAGERYWVGDKNKDFMLGKGDTLTT